MPGLISLIFGLAAFADWGMMSSAEGTETFGSLFALLLRGFKNKKKPSNPTAETETDSFQQMEGRH